MARVRDHSVRKEGEIEMSQQDGDYGIRIAPFRIYERLGWINYEVANNLRLLLELSTC